MVLIKLHCIYCGIRTELLDNKDSEDKKYMAEFLDKHEVECGKRAVGGILETIVEEIEQDCWYCGRKGCDSDTCDGQDFQSRT